MPLILGSESPRRKEILNFFDLPFTQVSPHFDESSIPFRDNPQEYVQTLAKGKLEVLRERYSRDIILTADTIVYKAGKVFGKPQNQEEAFLFLRELAGSVHSVYTGVALYSSGHVFQALEETKVQMNALTDDQIRQYHHSLHVADKAGGYRIQGAGGLIVRSIEGCYYNVMGLPLNALYTLLKQIGIDLWKHLKEN
jgi:septum formation protein